MRNHIFREVINIYGKYMLVFGIYYRKFKKQFIVASSFLILGVALIFPIPFILRRIIDTAIPEGNISLLFTLLIYTIALHSIQKSLMYPSNRIFFNLNSRIMLDLKTRILDKYSASKFPVFNSYTSEYIFTRISQDPGYINTLFGQQLVVLVKDILISLICLIGLSLISIKLSFIIVIIIPVLIKLTIHYSSRMKSIFTVYLENKAQENAVLQSLLRLLRFLKVSGREIVAIREFFKSASISYKTNIKYGKYHYRNIALGGLITSITPLLIFSYGGFEVIKGRMSLGSLLAFNAYVAYLFGSVQNILSTNITLQVALAALDRITEILDLTTEGSDQNVQIDKHCNIVSLELKDVVFQYDKDNILYKHMNISFTKNNMYGIVGSSGIGKSTLFNILLGTHKINSGTYLINNKPLSFDNIINIRKHFSLVDQEPLILPVSFYANFRLLNPNVSQEEIIEVAKRVHLHKYIQKQPEQYDTILDSRYLSLSVGQKQRLSIARSILKKPQVYLFDEVTSNLDSISESVIVSVINELSNEAIVIIVAHRLTTILNCDCIYVIEDGMVLEKGSHNELMNRNQGLYKQYYERQNI